MSLGRVLTIDDEEKVRAFVRKTLTPVGYEVIEADNGEQGIEIVSFGENPRTLDVIICGLRMPKMSGMDAVPLLRSQFPGIPVIVMTGMPSKDGANWLLELGVVDYLLKPVRPQILLDTVAKAMRIRHGEEVQQPGRMIPSKPACHGAFEALIRQFQSTKCIAAQIEGVSPELAMFLSKRPIDFAFQDFFPAPESEEFGWLFTHLPSFDGAFSFYAKKKWTIESSSTENLAALYDGTTQRVTIFLMQLNPWLKSLDDFLSKRVIGGFFARNLGHPLYNQLTFVDLAPAGDKPYWVFSAFTGGDWLALMKGDANTPQALRDIMAVALASNPLAGWLQATCAES